MALERWSELLQEFAASQGAGAISPDDVVHERLSAPHRGKNLPEGFGAIYVFTLSASYGATCPAGPHRTLKVGKARAGTSNMRFRNQHYGRFAQSTLAAKIADWPERWPELGIISIADAKHAGRWIKINCDRDHLFLPARIVDEARHALEQYLIARLQPIYEGRRPGLAPAPP